MILKSRLTRNFIEIKVDEIETTIFKKDKGEIEDTVRNLVNIIDDLARLSDTTFEEIIKQYA